LMYQLMQAWPGAVIACALLLVSPVTGPCSRLYAKTHGCALRCRRELPAHKALLRLQHWAACGAAGALRPAGGAAGHLVNMALHAVAARAGRLADPRMRSLRSVSHLASLWAGDRSSYKFRGRQVCGRTWCPFWVCCSAGCVTVSGVGCTRPACTMALRTSAVPHMPVKIMTRALRLCHDKVASGMSGLKRRLFNTNEKVFKHF